MRTPPASRPLAVPLAGQDHIVVDSAPPLASRGQPSHQYLAPVLELLEALAHPALVLDRRGRIAAETKAFLTLVADRPEAAEARALAPRLLLMEALAGTRRAAPDGSGPPHTLVSSVGGWQLELRLLTPPLALSRGLAVVTVAVRVRAASSEEFLAAHYRLTAREIPVAMLLGQGLSVACIAERLAISVHTVRRHGENVYRKLGVRSRAALAAAITRVAMTIADSIAGTG